MFCSSASYIDRTEWHKETMAISPYELIFGIIGVYLRITGMKKVLIITYYWPPSGGSGVQRWLKFAKYLPEYGWEPVIYTPENPEPNAVDTTLLKEIPQNLTVLKTKILEPYGIYKFLSGKKSDEKIEANIVAGKKSKSVAGSLFAFIRGNLFIPDPRCLWIRPSVRYLKKYLKENKIDAIISTGPPHSMHLIAKRVSKKCGVKWIADFRDPWTGIFYFKHLKMSGFALKRHQKLERSVLESAHRIIAVTENMARDFSHHTQADKIKVVQNGYDPADFAQAPQIEQLPEYEAIKNKFLLLHTGIMADNGNPDVLWRVLGNLCRKDAKFRERLQIRSMGQVDRSVTEDVAKYGLQNNFIHSGYVPHSIIPTWQMAGDLLLLPLRKEPEAAGILTGKFFEYLAAGGEIMAFGPPDGELAKALADTAGGTIHEWNDEKGVEDAVLASYNRYCERVLKNPDYKRENSRTKEIDTNRVKYSRKNLAGEMAGIMNELLQ